MNYFITIILALVSFYVLLLSIVFLFQRNLLYHPSVNNYLKDKVTNEPTAIEKVKNDESLPYPSYFNGCGAKHSWCEALFEKMGVQILP